MSHFPRHLAPVEQALTRFVDSHSQVEVAAIIFRDQAQVSRLRTRIFDGEASFLTGLTAGQMAAIAVQDPEVIGSLIASRQGDSTVPAESAAAHALTAALVAATAISRALDPESDAGDRISDAERNELASVMDDAVEKLSAARRALMDR